MLYFQLMTFGEKLNFARKRAGITQERIARRFRITPQAVSGWERGDSLPELEKIPVLAQMLMVPTDWLLSDAEVGTAQADKSDPWLLWQRLQPEQRDLALQMLRTMADQADQHRRGTE